MIQEKADALVQASSRKGEKEGGGVVSELRSIAWFKMETA